MSDCCFKCLEGSFASTVVVGLLSVYVGVSGECSENAIKATSLEVFFCLLASVLQAMAACYVVDRFEKSIICAFHKVSLVAAFLFFWSEDLIKNCSVEDLQSDVDPSDVDPFKQAIKLQMVAVCLLGLSVISALACGVCDSRKNKKEQVVEGELLRV